jgi:hypothetical protein
MYQTPCINCPGKFSSVVATVQQCVLLYGCFVDDFGKSAAIGCCAQNFVLPVITCISEGYKCSGTALDSGCLRM